ncbi:MAG TPA: hypothetical protein PLM44_02335 [bacterium]|nr:hypothetical protein [bacterium]
MKNISDKQAKKNAKLTKIKKDMDKTCYFCGKEGNDLCHILPKSLFPQYYTQEWNLIILCRKHYKLFDDNIEFRKMFDSLYRSIIKKVNKEDYGLVQKYFGK